MAAEFIIQDESNPTATANAYISLAFFKQYCLNRGYTYTATDEQIQIAIVKATDFVDARWQFAGLKWAQDQSTECPRQGVVNRAGYWVVGFPISFQQACAEYALLALTQSLMPSPVRDESNRKVAAFTKEIGGAITKSVEYVGSGAYEWPKYPLADRMMRRSELVAQSGGELVRA